MIKIILTFVIFFNFNAFSSDDLIDMRGKSIWERRQIMENIRKEESSNTKTVSQQSNQFINNLKDKGAAGLDESRSMLTGDKEMTSWVNKEAGLPDQGDAFNQLKGDLLTKGGKIKEFRKIGQDEELLNGNSVKTKYQIQYENKRTRTVEFLYVKPTVSGGHHLMEVKILD